MRTFLFGLTACIFLSAASPARAVNITDVATMLEEDNPYDARISLGLRTTLTHGALNKEYQGNNKGIEVVRDLRFKQVKMTLDLKAEFAIFKNLAVYIGLPIVLRQQNTYKFASGSLYSGYAGEQQCRLDHPDDPSVCNPDGVNARNSRTVQDGIAAGLSGIHYDAGANSMMLGDFDVAGGQAGPRTLYRGPNRAGLDQLHLGLHWLVHGFKQKDDPTKPNWRIGAEFRLSVGKVMDFERNSAGDTNCGAPLGSATTFNCRPQLNDAVSKGIHEVQFYTSLSKRLGILDSFFHLYFRMPFAYRSGSFYSDKYNFSSDWGEDGVGPVNKAPKQAGIHFGTDIIAWESPADHIKFAIHLMGMVDYRFPGRDYSEAYELLAGSPMLNMHCDPNNPSTFFSAMCGDNAVRRAMMFYPGVTQVQDHAIFGGTLGLDLLLYKYVQLSLSYTLIHRQEHFITMTDAGQDLDGDRRVTIPSREQNPWHRPIIDTPGHRYRVQELFAHQFWVNVQARF